MTGFVSTRLTERHDVYAFSCGNDDLDSWLHREAMRAQRAGVCRVAVWTPTESPEVVSAFFSVAPTQVVASDAGLSRSFAGGYSVVPGWLVGRLAVSSALQGRGVGSQVLLDAVETVVSVADKAGGRLIVVDPVDDAAALWYARLGFTAFGATQQGATRPSRRYMRVDRALETLGRA